MDYLTSPSVGTVSQSTPKSDTKVSTLRFVGQKFSFSYPIYFQPVQSTPVTGSDIEKYAFVTSRTATWNLSVKVTSLSLDSLYSDGSYNLRKTNPQTYMEEVVTLGTNEAHIMSYKDGGYSKVVFLLNSGIDASILLSSSSVLDSSKMDDILNQIITSWKWL